VCVCVYTYMYMLRMLADDEGTIRFFKDHESQVFVSVFLLMRVFVCVCVRVCVYVRMCVCVCACVCVYIYICMQCMLADDEGTIRIFKDHEPQVFVCVCVC